MSQKQLGTETETAVSFKWKYIVVFNVLMNFYSNKIDLL